MRNFAGRTVGEKGRVSGVTSGKCTIPLAPALTIKKLEERSSSSSSVDNHKPSTKMGR